MLFPLFDLNPRQRFPLFTLLIIGLNIAVMVWLSTQSEQQQIEISMRYGFVPARLTNLGKGRPVEVPVLAPVRIPIPGFHGARLQLAPLVVLPLSTKPTDVYATFLTMMFLHGSWVHLLMNMWMLWLFGDNIEDRLGHAVFLMFYVLGGVLASLTFWITAPDGLMPVIGASGAVAAVLGAYAITFPTAKVRTLVFFIFILIVDLPALVLLGIWFLLQVVSGMLGLWGIAMEPVAFWAHIGGFVAGLILMPLLSFGASPPGTDWRKESDEMFRFDDPRWYDRDEGREMRDKG